MGIILSLIVLVAALNIVNPLTMMVIEKTKEIGILKAMGATDKSVTTIFMFEGMLIGIFGDPFLGLVIGFIVCEIIAKSCPSHYSPAGEWFITSTVFRVKVDPFVSYFIVPAMAVFLCSWLHPLSGAAGGEARAG